jgi:hypothetical protein
MKRFAENESDKFAKLLEINGIPCICNDMNASSMKSECVLSLYLSLFDWVSDFIYSSLKPNLIAMKGVPKSSIGFETFCRLSWTFHCLMVYLPTKFPNIRQCFLLSDEINNNTTSINMLDAITTIPGNICQCLNSLPFSSLSTFLCCFGATKRGIYMASHEQMGVVESSFPSVHKIVQSISVCERLLNEKKSEGQPSVINELDAVSICSEVFGIDSCFWIVQSSGFFSIKKFQEHYQELRSFLDSQKRAIKDSRVRSHFASLVHRASNNLGKDTTLSEDSSLVCDTAFDEEILPEDRRLSKSTWLAERGLSTNPMTKRKFSTEKTEPKTVFQRDIRLQCVIWAAQIMKEKWNTDGRSIDIQLAEDISFSEFPSVEADNQSLMAKIHVDLYPLGKGDSPCVMKFMNAFSPGFLVTDFNITNTTPFCKVTTSDGGSSSIAAFFHCQTCMEEKKLDTDKQLFAPLMRIGFNNSVAAILANSWECKKMEIATKICNSIIETANCILLETKSELLLRRGDTSATQSQQTFSSVVSTIISGFPNLDEISNDDSFFESSFNPFPLHISNCNISKVGNKAKYGSHQDSSWILNSPKARPKKCMTNGTFLPTKDEMPVLTMITGTGNCQASVSWHKDRKELLSIETDNNCIHLQLCGVQDNGIFHQSDFLKKKEALLSRTGAPQDTIVRKIDTFRMTACPSCDQEVYREGIVADNLDKKRRSLCVPWQDYSRFNVMSKIELHAAATPCEVSDNLPDLENSPAGSLEEYEHEVCLPAKFANPEESVLQDWLHEDKLHSETGLPIRKIVPLTTRYGFSLPYRYQIFSHYQFSSAALERNSVFRFVDKNSIPIADQALFLDNSQKHGGEILLPGDLYQIHELPIIHSKTSTTVIMEELPNIALVVHAYKNDPLTFRNWNEMIESFVSLDISKEIDFDTFSKKYNQLDGLIVNGFSGSQQVCDAVAPNARTLFVDSPHYKVGFPQQCGNAQNAIFNTIREQGRAVALFLRPSSWGDPDISSFAKKLLGQGRESLFPDVALFFGYFYISSLCSNQFTSSQVKDTFAFLNNYYDSERINCTYLCEQFLQYKFSPVFNAQQIRRLVSMRKNKESLRHICINQNDNRSLTVSQNELFRYMSLKDAHHSDVTSSVMRSYLCSMIVRTAENSQEAGFLEALSQGFTRKRSRYANYFSVHQIAVICFHIQAAAAMRFLRRNVSNSRNKKGDTYITPLLGDDSDLLPDPLRLYALPCVNPDLDPVTQFAIAQMKSLFHHYAFPGNSFPLTNDYFINTCLSLQHTSCQEFLCDCLFACTINRFTGAIHLLSQYQNSEVSGMHLPHVNDWKNFILFLDKLHGLSSMPSIFSQQHFRTIPKQIRSNNQSLTAFITNLGSSEKGFPLLLRRMKNSRKTGLWPTHEELFSWLFDCLRICGEFPAESSIKFLTMKIIGDVEALFPCFVRRSMNDEVILGWGSQNGLDCVNILQDNEKPFPFTHNQEKFVAFHIKLIDFYHSKGENLLQGTGWKIHEGTIVSCVNHRPFSFLDSEHILCKVWLAVIQSQSCRNLSKNPHLFLLHCYPLCDEASWLSELKPIMQSILDRFRQLKEEQPTDANFQYPDSLMFPGERLYNLD